MPKFLANQIQLATGKIFSAADPTPPPPGDGTPPGITSSSAISVAEIAPLAHALAADEAVTWTIVGGVDQALFEVSGSTLRWNANGTRDFEAPADANGDNVYHVTVRATDGSNNASDQAVTVTVTDVGEGGSGSAGQPIGLLLTITKAA